MPTALPLRTALIALTLLLPACGGASSSGPGPQADAAKTPAALQTEVKDVETPVLQKTVAAYNDFIASKEDELKALEAKIKEQAGGAIDALMGEGKTDELKADVEELKASVESIRKELEAVRAKLEVYVKELAARG